MTKTMANLELNKFMSDDAPDEGASSRKYPWKIGGLIAICLLIACYFAADFFINKKKSELLLEVKARQEIAVSGKAEVLKTWIEETGQRANQIASHPLFRLFAAEINQVQGGTLPRALSNQLPYMQNVITNFVKQSDLIAAYVIGKDGRAYLASNGSPNLTDSQRKLAMGHYSSRNISSTPIQVSSEDLIFDFLIPVFSEQSSTANDQEDVVGVLMMTVSASQQLAQILKPSRLSLEGEQTLLFQVESDLYHAITPKKAPYLSSEPTSSLSEGIDHFGLRKISDRAAPTYSIGAPVQDTRWAVLQGLPVQTALEPLQEYSYGIYALTGSLFIVIISIFSGIWLKLQSQNTKEMANQYRDFARQINAQRRLLGSINNTIDDLIGLTDSAGKYVYANPALARFVDFPVNAIESKTDRDLFGDKPARKLQEINQQVMDTQKTTRTIMELSTHAGTKILRVEKSRLLDDDNQFMGIVTVAADITEFMMHQRQKEELGRKTISILVRMMENNDPYLAGHSQRMGELSGNIARILELPADITENIATGANLSQIGKISIPSEIRTKESRLTKNEMEQMMGHVGQAEALLTEMEVDQPVITAVTQMYERLDGSGYPHNLKESEIDLSARILGITDVLVARVSPRSYRQAISVEEAMEVFRTNPGKYDVDVVIALDNFLASNEGKKFKENVSDKLK